MIAPPPPPPPRSSTSLFISTELEKKQFSFGIHAVDSVIANLRGTDFRSKYFIGATVPDELYPTLIPDEGPLLETSNLFVSLR